MTSFGASGYGVRIIGAPFSMDASAYAYPECSFPAVDYPDPEFLCRALMSKALNRGARDNVTVVVIKR